MGTNVQEAMIKPVMTAAIAPGTWLRLHQGISPEKLPLYLRFFHLCTVRADEAKLCLATLSMRLSDNLSQHPGPNRAFNQTSGPTRLLYVGKPVPIPGVVLWEGLGYRRSRCWLVGADNTAGTRLHNAGATGTRLHLCQSKLWDCRARWAKSKSPLVN